MQRILRSLSAERGSTCLTTTGTQEMIEMADRVHPASRPLGAPSPHRGAGCVHFPERGSSSSSMLRSTGEGELRAGRAPRARNGVAGRKGARDLIDLTSPRSTDLGTPGSSPFPAGVQRPRISCLAGAFQHPFRARIGLWVGYADPYRKDVSALASRVAAWEKPHQTSQPSHSEPESRPPHYLIFLGEVVFREPLSAVGRPGRSLKRSKPHQSTEFERRSTDGKVLRTGAGRITIVTVKG